MTKLEYENPFCNGELDNLRNARENNDIEYLKEWTKAAVKKHEDTRGKEIKYHEKAIKWDKLINSMSVIMDKIDLVDLEIEPK